MMKLSFKLKFWLAIGLQIIILISVWGFNQIQFVAGEKVLLKLVPPRDPLSLFQGHYLRLNYEISELGRGEYEGPTDFQRGETIYVVLEKNDNYWEATAVSRSKPKDEVFIKGNVLANYRGSLRIEYGIESYFIPEENWQEVENTFRGLERYQDVFIEVSISRSGSALIRKIFIDKEEIDVSKIGTAKERPGGGARDARIISALSQARTVMTYIGANDGHYDNFTCQQEDMRALCDEIASNNGWTTIAHDAESDSQEACIYSPLNAQPNYWYCADSLGYAGATAIFPGGTGYCVDGESAKCPPVENY